MVRREILGVSGALLLLVSGLSAQAATVVTPSGNLITNGNTSQLGVFGNGGGSPITFQWDFTASELNGLVGTTLTGIGFRLPGGSSTVSSSTSVGVWDLELSGSLNAFGSLNPTPSNNIAPGGTTVYDQSLVIPANSFVGGAGPNPFYVINFTTPYTYFGGDLLMTVTNPGTANLAVDANFVDAHGDTAACFSTGCQAQFFNYPITEFQFTPGFAVTPVPPALPLFISGLSALGLLGWRRKRKNTAAFAAA